VGGVLVLALVSGLGVALLGREERAPTPAASPTPTEGGAAAEVACGGEVPAAASAPRPTFDRPPPMRIRPETRRYSAVLHTSCGTIEVELLADVAPRTVNNFVFLARRGFYDGLTFHRVVRGFVIQGGDPRGDGTGGPGYTFQDELDNDLRYEVGTVAMANSGPDTNGSQFFIVTGERGTELPKRYTIFGRVTRGLDVALRIADLESPETPEHPAQTVYIEKATIEVERRR
jgi:cyclophilin family peptidyl-prolyl cis-trans isomerase